MKPPILKYTNDQQRVIAVLNEKPLTRDELLSHFPHKTKQQILTMLRHPRDTGKIFTNFEGKHEVYSPPPGLKVIKGSPQSYVAPTKVEFIYEPSKFPREY